MFKKPTCGFTLIEVLVVIVIIGSLVSLAVFSIGSKPKQDQLERESMRLQSTLRWVLDEALSQNNEWGIRIEQNRYTFYQFNNKKRQWDKVDDIKDADKTELKGLFEHKLPDGYWVKVQVEGDALTLANTKETDTKTTTDVGTLDKQNNNPSILLLSSGEYTPFVIDLGFENEHKPLFSLYGDGIADITLISGDDIEKHRRP